ncbi:MAG: aminotransferase class V-fold PLP-dependent enzyme [Bowdeniella nasicola]|nr:aminotransferase class V-fold PLP-dependent enzyme [Bowdeniella nasicola]
MSVAYLDHAATAPARPAAVEAYAREASRSGNPSSLHQVGRAARERLEQAREQIAELMGARPAEVIFTSGGSEADALMMLGTAGALTRRGVGGRLAYAEIEHDAVRGAARAAEELYGMPAVALACGPDGRLELDGVRIACEEGLALLTVQWANNETGVLQPVAEAAELAASAGAIVHSDAVQAVGRVPVDFTNAHLSALSLTGHKIGAPVGTGVLLARTDTPLIDIRPGGGQERGVRSGTLDVAGAVALATALAEAEATRAETSARLASYVTRLRHALRLLPGVRLTGPDPDADVDAGVLPGFVHLVVCDADAEALLMLADLAGIAATSSSACHAGVQSLSHVVTSLGYGADESVAPLRLSLGWNTTEAEVEAAIAALPGIIEAARAARGGRR